MRSNTFQWRLIDRCKGLKFNDCNSIAEVKNKCNRFINENDKPFNQLEPKMYLRLESVKGLLELLSL